MKKLIVLLTCLCAPLSSAFALLPPFYQSVTEYETLLKEPRLNQLLGSGEVIESIEKTPNGYIVKGNRKQVEVQLVYENQKMPGPAKFHFVFKNPTEISK